MEIAQELELHRVQFGQSFHRFRRGISKGPVVVVLFLVAMGASWEYGFRNGRAVAYDSSSQTYATHMLMSEKKRMDGQAQYAEQLVPPNADFAVRRHVELADAPGLLGAFDRLLREREWMRFGPRANEDIKAVANLRLSTAVKPRPETLEAMRRMNASEFIRSRAAEYQTTAATYSKVLGRAVLPEELLTDADLRFQIEHLKSFAGVIDPGEK